MKEIIPTTKSQAIAKNPLNSRWSMKIEEGPRDGDMRFTGSSRRAAFADLGNEMTASKNLFLEAKEVAAKIEKVEFVAGV